MTNTLRLKAQYNCQSPFAFLLFFRAKFISLRHLRTPGIGAVLHFWTGKERQLLGACATQHLPVPASHTWIVIRPPASISTIQI